MNQEIRYLLTYDMYQEYATFLYDRVSKGILRKVIFTVLMILICILMVLFAYRTGDHSYLYIMIIPVIGEIAVLLILTKKKQSSIEKMWASNPSLQDGEMHITLSFFEDHFEQVSAIGTINLAYDKLFCGYETDHYIYLMISRGQGVNVPKSLCDDELISFLREKIDLK